MKGLLTALIAMCSLAAGAVDFNYEAGVTANASSGALAPYMLGSWNGDRLSAATGICHDGLFEKRPDTSLRFDWSAGIEYILGYGSAAHYDHWQPDNQTWTTTDLRPAPIRLQQLWGSVRYRGIFATAGMHEQPSLIVDGSMSSGDITRSNNARPIPGLEIGFNDFQNIPFTNGWVQIEGRIMYGRMTDTDYKDNFFNRYSGIIASDLWYTYKRCYFRTKPSQPLSITVGMQTAGLFAGETKFYNRGTIYRTETRGFHLRDIWDMFFPTEGGEDYYKGSSLGSWDFKADIALRNGSSIKAYFEWPWEDGSGIGRRNGWDGLWGVQYNFARTGWVSKVLVEYVDFTNQSGWIHFSHTDNPGTTIGSHADGGDNYYNNDYYGPYANYGMAIGTPFIVAPAYNSDGRYAFLHNRARGFHAAVAGDPSEQWSYTLKVSWQRAGGDGRRPARELVDDTSAMAGVNWRPASVPGLTVSAKAAFDAGRLRGNNFGAMVGVTYSGKLSFNRKKSAK
ncbi:MAG: capsule assembly Wzi family protein [Muribaculaceae bacterium]|nr:capsule assembly Wzi family protein [Muribaculaceae bacterium]